MFVYTAFHAEHKKKHIDNEGDLNIYGENIQRFLPVLDEMLKGGLVTLEKVRVIHYRADQEVPASPVPESH